MAEINHNVTSMLWRAPLLRLTCIANPDVNEGRPTNTFVPPEAIGQIRRMMGSYRTHASLTDVANPPRYHPGVECTEVHCGMYTLLVTESPETVAMLRDRALGFEPGGPKAVT